MLNKRAQAGWTQIDSSSGPSARSNHAAAVDPSGRFWIFGGAAPGEDSEAQTWVCLFMAHGLGLLLQSMLGLWLSVLAREF